jgi:membrane associated rhomboid family serine protease
VFFIQLIAQNLMIGGIPGSLLLNQIFALNPMGGVTVQGAELNFYIWQLITYQFMHGGFFHILINMFILWMFGMELENNWGSRKFLTYYLTCGVGAGVAQLLFPALFGSMVGPTIGASGSVFGIMIAFALYFPNRYIYIYFLLPVKAKYFIAFIILIEFMSVGDMSFVAHFAHIGGAFTGFVLVTLDSRTKFNYVNVTNYFRDLFSSSSGKASGSSKGGFRKPPRGFTSSRNEVEDAEFYEINSGKKDKDEVSQEEIDRILDKISESGYQNLTEREKRVLFEASKKR